MRGPGRPAGAPAALTLAALALAAAVPTGAAAGSPGSSAGTTTASVLFEGDFETGLRPPWTSLQHDPREPIERVSWPVREGAYAARFEVRDGFDAACDGSDCDLGERAELLWGGGRRPTLPTGAELYFGWSTRFERGFVSPRRGQGQSIFFQIHPGEGSPRVSLQARANGLRLGDEPRCGWNPRPLPRGIWLDFVLRVRLSRSPRRGLVELWYDGPGDRGLRRVIRDCRYATAKGGASYLKLGYYRNSRRHPRTTDVVFHDALRVGTSYGAVRPRSVSRPAPPPG